MNWEEQFKDFAASKCLLGKWKNCYEIRQLVIYGEKLSADQNGASDFKNEFKSIAEKYSLGQIFNADVTGLNFKRLPAKNLSCKLKKSAPGYNRSKERITVLLCSNASWDLRLLLIVIGKS